MIKKDFSTWNLFKTVLHNRPADQHFDNKNRFFQVRDIWYCSIGLNVGHEQDGKHQYFERPVLIVQKFSNDIFWAVPLTSKIKSGPYYCTVAFSKHISTAVLSQLRLLDARRLVRKVGYISQENHSDLIEKIIFILKLNGSPKGEPRSPKA